MQGLQKGCLHGETEWAPQLPSRKQSSQQPRFSTLVKTLDFENTLSVEGNVQVASRGAVPRQSSEDCVQDIMNGPDGILSFQRNVW